MHKKNQKQTVIYTGNKPVRSSPSSSSFQVLRSFVLFPSRLLVGVARHCSGIYR